MKRTLFLVLWGGIIFCSLAQQNKYAVIAESGDGIYSILRKQGLDPIKYYQAFIELNGDLIKDGSFLQEGREYWIPYASDSFKNTAIRVTLPEENEEPLFDDGLNALTRKSDKLKNTVYYLIPENPKDGFTLEIGLNLAKELMLHGATVFVLENPSTKEFQASMKREADITQTGNFVAAVNKRYLKHSGKYQRLLVIRSNGLIENGNINVAVYHHERSKDGQRLAENIQEVFEQKSKGNSRVKEAKGFVEDKKGLYLAKNVLPAISLLNITNQSRTKNPEDIPVSSNQKVFSQWLATGILKDYANLELEEED
nr:hypothetical protein [Allomuricauda sp.]